MQSINLYHHKRLTLFAVEVENTVVGIYSKESKVCMWDPAIVQLIGTLGGVSLGSVTTFLITWLTLRSQYRLKLVELSEGARLRGKELLFTTYQQRVKSIDEELSSLGKSIGGIVALYHTADEEERRELDATFLQVVREGFNISKERFEELQNARRETGLEAANPVQTKTVEEFLATDIEAIAGEEEARRALIGFTKATVITSCLWSDVLNKQAQDLFGEYAPKTRH